MGATSRWSESLCVDNESIVAIVVEGIKIMVDANSEERSRAERNGLMGNEYTDRVSSMEGHPNMEVLPSFCVLEVKECSILPHWTTLRRIWIARMCVPPVNRIAWLIEIDRSVVSYKLHIEDKAVRFGVIRGIWLPEQHFSR